MSNSKFTLFRSLTNEQFYFNLKAPNGEIILKSEGYLSKASCENGIDSVKENAPHDSRYERKEAEKKYWFVLKAPNGKTIGQSETYPTAAARDNGIESVKKNAPDAPTEDNS